MKLFKRKPKELTPEQQEAARCYLAVYCLGENS